MSHPLFGSLYNTSIILSFTADVLDEAKSTLKFNLYDYQIFGTRFAIDRINNHKFCIIADDVGLGRQTY